MKITGIVTEYNPFHNGHRYHIEKAREISQPDVLIAVMSGHFVQRGEPAICDKWQRTLAALQNGVDMVIELPVAFATQSAENFAYKSVEILALAQASTLVFGSESNDLATMQEIASLPIRVDSLKESMRLGHSYPKAIGLYAGEYDPNDILGIAYCRACHDFNIQPRSIIRTNAYHSLDIDQPIASATAIRNALKNNHSITHQTPMHSLASQGFYPDWTSYFPFVRHTLLSAPKEVLKQIFLVSEGIENHMIKQALIYDDAYQFIEACICRRYSRARIQRIMVHILLHHTKTQIQLLPPIDTLRILGFNTKGKQALRYFRQKEIKTATRLGQIPAPYRRLEIKATQIYATAFPSPLRQAILDKEKQGPVILSD